MEKPIREVIAVRTEQFGKTNAIKRKGLRGMHDDRIKLSRYRRGGTDCLILDPNRNQEALSGKKAEYLCRRTLGIGGDSVLYGPILEDGKMRLKIFQGDRKLATAEKVYTFERYLTDACYLLPSAAGILEVEDEGRLTSLERVEGLGVKEGREAGFVEEIYLRESFFVS